jgi:hypothetical protein
MPGRHLKQHEEDAILRHLADGLAIAETHRVTGFSEQTIRRLRDAMPPGTYTIEKLAQRKAIPDSIASTIWRTKPATHSTTSRSSPNGTYAGSESHGGSKQPTSW